MGGNRERGGGRGGSFCRGVRDCGSSGRQAGKPAELRAPVTGRTSSAMGPTASRQPYGGSYAGWIHQLNKFSVAVSANLVAAAVDAGRDPGHRPQRSKSREWGSTSRSGYPGSCVECTVCTVPLYPDREAKAENNNRVLVGAVVDTRTRHRERQQRQAERQRQGYG